MNEIIDTAKMNTDAGKYTVTWYVDDAQYRPEDSGFAAERVERANRVGAGFVGIL